MGTAEQYADWIVKNESRKGTPEFDTVAQAYKLARQAEPTAPSSAPEVPSASVVDTLKGNVSKAANLYGDYAMGGLRGAARIGTTLMRPLDAMGVTGTTNPQRVASIEQFFTENANPSSLPFKGGDIVTQIAGTAGVPGLMGKGVMAASKAIPALSNVAPKLATALESGGLSLGVPGATTIPGMVGNAALRSGGGAVSGGAMAGLVDPEQAKTGAIIGGVLPGAVKVAGAAGSGLRSAGEHILGAMTGTGTEAIKGAFKAGQTGSKDFLSNMRGESSFDDVVTAAKQGLRTMRAERGAHYRSGMVDIKADKSILDMAPITKAVDDLTSAGSFKGKVINEKSAGVVKEISDKVDDWAKSAPDEFHTPEGLDALKQAIGDIRDSTQFGTQARRAADTVYNAIKSQIQAQAPTYSKVMKDYSEASQTISEIEKALSLGEKSSKDTAIRKLQSLLRNNAQTNYGNRLALAKTLEDKGGVDLGPAIAGQAMNSWMPRGMVGSIEKAGMVGAPFVAPQALLAAPFTSPRLMGEALYGMGRLSGGASSGLGGMLGVTGQNAGLLEQALSNPAMRAALLSATNRGNQR